MHLRIAAAALATRKWVGHPVPRHWNDRARYVVHSLDNRRRAHCSSRAFLLSHCSPCQNNKCSALDSRRWRGNLEFLLVTESALEGRKPSLVLPWRQQSRQSPPRYPGGSPLPKSGTADAEIVLPENPRRNVVLLRALLAACYASLTGRFYRPQQKCPQNRSTWHSLSQQETVKIQLKQSDIKFACDVRIQSDVLAQTSCHWLEGPEHEYFDSTAVPLRELSVL